jgi:uncharacterized protein YjbI with pentapeptide repeats
MSKQTHSIQDRADLFAENFLQVNLSGQKIFQAEFEECTFSRCDFSQIEFSACRFIDCRFENCDLSVAKLTDCKLSGITFKDCKLIGIDWTRCDWTSLLVRESMNFYDCILNDCNFYALELDRCVMKNCQVKQADMCEGSFKNAKFHGSDFHRTLFDNTHLEFADFSEAKNVLLKLSDNHFKNTKLSHFDALSLLESEGIIVS